MTEGKDPACDPEFLLEKLGSFDFASVGSDGAEGKGLEALSELRRTLAKVPPPPPPAQMSRVFSPAGLSVSLLT